MAYAGLLTISGRSHVRSAIMAGVVQPQLLIGFDDDTAYERLVLRTIANADAPPPGTVFARDDLRGEHRELHRGVHASLGGDRVAELRTSLRPLAFGAAYKVLDLLVEMVMRLNGKRSASGRWTFEEKGTFVAAGVPAQRPVSLDRAPDHWGRLAALYLAFVEHRHALVHRRTQVANDGALHATDRAGRPLTPIAADEQDAFVRLAEQVASAVVADAANARLANRIAWELDALTSHDGQPSLSAQRPANVIRQVVVNLEAVDGGRWRLDGGRVHEHIRTQQASPFDADLEAHAPVGAAEAIYDAHCDDVPEESITFGEGAPPPWLRRRMRP